MIDIKNELINIIQNVCKNEQLKITDDTNLFDDIGLDSILFVALIIEIENTFHVVLDDFDFSNKDFFKFSNITNYISACCNENTHPS